MTRVGGFKNRELRILPGDFSQLNCFLKNEVMVVHQTRVKLFCSNVSNPGFQMENSQKIILQMNYSSGAET